MDFKEAYKQLNKAQKEAVDTVEGPVMVVAGPGTGKTKILTLRIANILEKTQVNPDNILALTYSRAGASEMQKRLAGMIGTPAYRVTISTFHGFCEDIIKQNPSAFPRIIGAESIIEVDQVNIIQQAISELSLRELKPYGEPLYYMGAIISSIDKLKREDVSPEDFRKMMLAEEASFANISDLYHEKGAHKGKMKGDYQKLLKQIAKNLELCQVYEFYQKTLAEKKLYDYNDMIMEVVRELGNNSDLLLQLQEQYQYVLVDEHQDTNNAQNKLIELLCNFHDNPNLFVVGDEKQAIYRFQGASLENFLYFKKLYPSSKLIVLEENYRSHQSILDAAHNILAGHKPLKSQAGSNAVQINLGEFTKPAEELYFIAQDIQRCIADGIPPEEIAILYRENRDALNISRALDKLGILHAIESKQDIMADSDIRKLLLLFKTAVNFGSEELILESLHIDFVGVDELEIYKIIAEAQEKRISAYSLVKTKFPAFYADLSRWATLAKNENAEQCFEIIMRESGFLSSILEKVDAGEKLDRVQVLFNKLQDLVMRRKQFSLGEFLDYLATLEAHKILLEKANRATPGRVRLMTAHGAKGQEFDCVYIANAFNGHWGNKRRPQLITLPDRIFSLGKETPEHDTDDGDERRLFYVAITRARKEITITYAGESLDGKQLLPAQFITEIKPELIKQIDVEKIKKELSKHKDFFYSENPEREVDIKNKEFIRRIFTTFGLSVTALNNYLRCPWNYFYTNLLRIPKAKTKHQMYGTAIHNALRDLFDPHTYSANSEAEQKHSRVGVRVEEAKVKLPSMEWLLDRFITYIAKEPMTENDVVESSIKGRASLRGWYEKYSSSWNLNTLTEFNIKGVVIAPDVRITGKLDKIELSDGVGVNVVDYKTSKPKTRGEIEGTTQNSNGDIKRQLIFYKLLLNNFDEGKKFKMQSAEIDFIEPNEKGDYKKESFTITDEEVAELTELIKKTADEILNLKFWNKTCEDKDCEYCALRKMMTE